MPGLTVLDDPANAAYPMPWDVSGEDDVFVGRIRQDISNPNGLALWIVSDNLRKGAALNSLQIAEELLSRGRLKQRAFTPARACAPPPHQARLASEIAETTNFQYQKPPSVSKNPIATGSRNSLPGGRAARAVGAAHGSLDGMLLNDHNQRIGEFTASEPDAR